MSRKFELRFEGKSNAGLRKQIREAVSGHRCGDANAKSVLALDRTVALSASGRATLESVAEDYRRAGESRGNDRCDCDACYAGKLQALGANG